MREPNRHPPRLLRPEPGEGDEPGSIAAIAAARVVIPGAIAVAGLVLLAVGQTAIGGTLLGIAAHVVLIDWFARLSLRSDGDREREDAARRYFTRTGRWPDDDSPADPG